MGRKRKGNRPESRSGKRAKWKEAGDIERGQASASNGPGVRDIGMSAYQLSIVIVLTIYSSFSRYSTQAAVNTYV
jgi:hypothetical protein